MRSFLAEALAAIEAAEARLASEQERERLRLYRLRLQATVVAVSPLTVDLAAQQGFGMTDIAAMLRGSPQRVPGMPHLHAFRQQLIPARKGHPTHSVAGVVRDTDVRISRRIAREGIVLPQARGTRDRLGIVPTVETLECAGWLGPCWFSTDGPVVHLLMELPEIVTAVAPGRLVGEIVDHPALTGRSYRIRRALALPEGCGVVLSFETGMIDHAMPWAEELAREMECTA